MAEVKIVQMAHPPVELVVEELDTALIMVVLPMELQTQEVVVEELDTMVVRQEMVVQEL